MARDHQPTKSRSPQRAPGDTRIVSWWNLRANVTGDENEWRTAQWRTCKAGRALADSWRQRKSARNVRARKVRHRIICFWHWCTASRSTNFSRSRSSKRKISIDERKRDAAARLCSVWLRHHVFRGGITLDLVTTRVPQRGDTVSDCETCHLRTTPKSCGTVRPGQGSHNTGGTECLLLGNRTGISLGLIRDVSQTVSGPYCLRRQLERHVPVPKRTKTRVCLNGVGAWRPLCFLVSLMIRSLVQSPGRSTEPPPSSAPQPASLPLCRHG